MKTLPYWLSQFWASGSRDPKLSQDCDRLDRQDAMGFNPARDFLEPDLDPRLKAHDRLKVGKAYFTSSVYLSQQDRADWAYTDPRIRFFAGRMAHELRRRLVPIYAHSAFRTPQEQRDLQRKRVSKASFPMAPHTQGKAVDLVHSRFHWNDMRPEDWAYLGKVGKTIAARHAIPITWGGDWKKFYDPAHWELSDWRSDVQRTPFPDHPPLRRTLFYINRNTSLPPSS